MLLSAAHNARAHRAETQAARKTDKAHALRVKAARIRARRARAQARVAKAQANARRRATAKRVTATGARRTATGARATTRWLSQPVGTKRARSNSRAATGARAATRWLSQPVGTKRARPAAKAAAPPKPKTARSATSAHPAPTVAPPAPRNQTPASVPSPRKGSPVMAASSADIATIEDARNTITQFRQDLKDFYGRVDDMADGFASRNMSDIGALVSGMSDDLDAIDAKATDADRVLQKHEDVAEAVQALGGNHANEMDFYAR